MVPFESSCCILTSAASLRDGNSYVGARAWRRMTTRCASYDRVCVRVNARTHTHARTRRREVNSCAHDQSLRANIASFCMLRCQHRYDILPVRATHIWTRTHMYMCVYACARTRRAHVCPTVGVRARPFAHRGTNTCYTHTVNLAPRSNAGRIVPGLEDIKSLDYPIKSYSAPLPHPRKKKKITGSNHRGASPG